LVGEEQRGKPYSSVVATKKGEHNYWKQKGRLRGRGGGGSWIVGHHQIDQKKRAS